MNIVRVPEKGKPATPVSMGASFNGNAYLVERMAGYSICAAITETSASLVGTLKLQASNNAFSELTSNEPNPSAVWVDIPISEQAVSGTGTAFWECELARYEAVRIVWTRVSGDGTITPYFLAKDA